MPAQSPTQAALEQHAAPFFGFVENCAVASLVRGERTPEQDVDAYIAMELLGAQRRVRDYIAAVALRASTEERLRERLATAVMEANCRGVALSTAELLTFPGRQHDPMNTEQNGARDGQ